MPISKLIVEGFKSLRDRTEVDLANLTILAGANSSGKSSVMQPLLLLKQSYEVGYDPGPLLISGPNVDFSEATQMFWCTADDEARQFKVGVGLDISGKVGDIEIEFGRKYERGQLPIVIDSFTWFAEGESFTLAPDLTSDYLRDHLPPRFRQLELNRSSDPEVTRDLQVVRDRCVLGIRIRVLYDKVVISEYTWDFPRLAHLPSIEYVVKNVIHVPGLRGNPRRVYPVTAVGNQFPGMFHDYVASIIAQWRIENLPKLSQLGNDLGDLGLTTTVMAGRISDTQAEIQVGRVLGSRRDSEDLVSVADVGFGVAQVLPVAVALLAAEPQHLVYLEQPEIHLHPRAQIALAQLLARAVKRGVQVVVETHSELLLLGIQKLAATGELSPDDVILHWFERDDEGATHVNSAHLDRQGAFGDWPVDFAEVSMSAIRDYLTASMQPQ